MSARNRRICFLASLIGLAALHSRTSAEVKKKVPWDAPRLSGPLGIPYRQVDPLIANQVTVTVDVARSEDQYWIFPAFVVEEAEIAQGYQEFRPLINLEGRANVTVDPSRSAEDLVIQLRLRDLSRSHPGIVQEALLGNAQFKEWIGNRTSAALDTSVSNDKARIQLQIRRDDGTYLPVAQPQEYDRGVDNPVTVRMFKVTPQDDAYAYFFESGLRGFLERRAIGEQLRLVLDVRYQSLSTLQRFTVTGTLMDEEFVRVLRAVTSRTKRVYEKGRRA